MGDTFPGKLWCKSETNRSAASVGLSLFKCVVLKDKSDRTRRGYNIRESRYGFLKPELSKLYA
jgi:hypothetical protein